MQFEHWIYSYVSFSALLLTELEGKKEEEQVIIHHLQSDFFLLCSHQNHGKHSNHYCLPSLIPKCKYGAQEAEQEEEEETLSNQG